MLGRKDGISWSSLSRLAAELVPDDHVLARVDRVLDLSWLPAEWPTVLRRATGGPGSIPRRRCA